MAGNVSDLILGGDPATQLLQEVFAFDITLAKIRCGTCDSLLGLGSLALHGNSREAHVACSNCEGDLITASRTTDGLLLELRGTRHLHF
jgi:hypothetical protein